MLSPAQRAGNQARDIVCNADRLACGREHATSRPISFARRRTRIFLCVFTTDVRGVSVCPVSAPRSNDSGRAPGFSSVTIVVPTYKEVDSLPHLIDRVAAVRRDHGLEIDVLIMDDDSRDGTVELIAARPEPWVIP